MPEDNQPRTAAGRRWLRAYINGCGFKVFDATLPRHLAGVPFCNVVEWLYRTSGFVLIGKHPFTILAWSLQTIMGKRVERLIVPRASASRLAVYAPRD